MIRTSISFPDDLYEQLRTAAGEDHRSVSAEVVDFVERGLDERMSRRNRENAVVVFPGSSGKGAS